MMTAEEHLKRLEVMLRTVTTDRRDVWPAKLSSYTKGECLSSGDFGAVRYAESRDPTFGFDGLEVRRCVIKTIYMRKRLASILQPTIATTASSGEGEGDMDTKLTRLYRRTVMELYILNRCRHRNIVHAHAVFLSDGDLNIVLPRLYCLKELISMYRKRKNSEPVPVKIIAMIIRQLCLALDYLQRSGIIHRDVHQENVFITRGGTVKLGHFGQSKALLSDSDVRECRTPVGKEISMCYEKLHNLYGEELRKCLPYSFPADMWSLGVLILAMVSYFPDETSHRLRKDFAIAMHAEKMPFVWYIVDMLQLRSRLVKSGGEDLKLFVSDYLLTVAPEDRATAASLLKTPQMLSWCSKTVDEDRDYIRKKFIDEVSRLEVDFANQLKLENMGANYDYLESKDIPSEFYWSNTWKKLEKQEFFLKISFPSADGESAIRRRAPTENLFKLSSSEPLFGILYSCVKKGQLDLLDIIPLDYEIRETIYEIVARMEQSERGIEAETNATTSNTRPVIRKLLPICGLGQEVGGQVEIEIGAAPAKFHRLFSSP